MLHLRTLLQFTPTNIVNNSMRVRLANKEAMIDADDKGKHKLFTCLAKDSMSANPDSGPWHVIIRIYTRYPKGSMKSTHPGWVHCTCPYFKYYLEVAVAARGSSMIETSNGKFPKIRNPRVRPYLCKHLVKAFRDALRMKPKTRRLHNVTNKEIDKLIDMLDPYIPAAARTGRDKRSAARRTTRKR